MKALVESKGLFLNPSLRRLGIVALRIIEVFGRRRLVRCRRRHRYRRKIVDAIKVKIVARRRRCAATSLSQDLPRVSSFGDGFDGDHRLQYSSRLAYGQINRLNKKCEVELNT